MSQLPASGRPLDSVTGLPLSRFTGIKTEATEARGLDVLPALYLREFLPGAAGEEAEAVNAGWTHPRLPPTPALSGVPAPPAPGRHAARDTRSSTRSSRRHVGVRSAIFMHPACAACSVQGVAVTGPPVRLLICYGAWGRTRPSPGDGRGWGPTVAAAARPVRAEGGPP